MATTPHSSRNLSETGIWEFVVRLWSIVFSRS
jgi:hypothetical protein